MAAVTTGSWGQQKYLTHFCLTFLLATEFTDTPENTNRQNFAATYADTIFILKKGKKKLSKGNYQPEAGVWVASGFLP